MIVAALAAMAESETDKRLKHSAEVLEEVMGAFDKAIPQKVLDKSECAVIVPGLIKGAFIFGAKYGRGFVTCRKQGGVGWSALAGVRVEGGSFGFQFGGSETDVIMLVMNEKGAQRLLSNKFTVGVDAMAAAGPVGRTAEAETDATMRAEILTWSRSRGLFAGVSLQGATLRQDLDVNEDMYGKKMENKDVVTSGKAVPSAGQKLITLLSKYSARKVK